MLEALIIASERAANIARKCREDEHLFKLLIEEKHEGEANPRFIQDFKTLADVLIQETLKHDIGNQYPEIKEQIKGEESNIFCNALGESISVEKLQTTEETADLLAKVLDNDSEAARLLAEEVHRDLDINDVCTEIPDKELIASGLTLNYGKLGIWIDPIDSTAEYINGTNEGVNEDDKKEDIPRISSSGLQCVTVLIGVYDLEVGNPIIGVVNQPFYRFKDGRWRGRCLWGVCTPNLKVSSIQINKITPKENTENEGTTNLRTVCLSGSEDETIKSKLRDTGFRLVEAPGAGYKMLVTCLNLADVYLLSKNSTFKWDSCGPHALLKSLSGDIVIYEDAVERGEINSLKYFVDSQTNSKIDSCCNKGGIIAYRDLEVVQRVIDLFRK